MRPPREPSSRGSAVSRCCGFTEHAAHFRLVGQPAPYAISSRGTHGTKGGLPGVDFLEGGGVAAIEDGAAKRIVHRDELGNRDAAAVLRSYLLPSPGL
jgi:hypothetical protein